MSYNPDPKSVGKRVVGRRVMVRPVEVPKNCLVQQQFKDECDMNQIVARAQKGIAPRFLNRGVPRYGDFSDLPTSLDDAYALIARAEEAFMALPAELRRELDNDPRRLEGITKDQAARYGLDRKPVGGSEAEPVPPRQPAPKAPTEPVAKKKKGDTTPPPAEAED